MTQVMSGSGRGQEEKNHDAYSSVRLLNKELGEPDHLGIAIELFGEVDHSVRCILLVAVTAGGEKSHERLLRDRTALPCAPCCGLNCG